MTFSVFLLAFTSALFWAAFDSTRKMLTAHFSTVLLAFLLIAGQIPFYIAWALIDGGLGFSRDYWQYGFICIATNLFANLAFLQSVKISEISLTIPMLTLTPAFTSLISYFLMGETMTANQILGISFIICGSFLVQCPALISFIKQRESTANRRRYLGILLMIAVALSWSVTASYDKLALEYATTPNHALAQCLILSLIIAIFLRFKTTTDAVLVLNKRHLGLLLIAIIVATAALGTQLSVIQMMHVGVYEATKRSTGIIMAIIAGALLFKEKAEPLKIIASIIIILGIWLLYSA